MLRRRRQALAADVRTEASAIICTQLWAWACEHTLQDAPLALFAAHNFEPNVDEVGRRWIDSGRALALPRVVQMREGARLQFVLVESLAELRPSALGLREAWGADAQVVPTEDLGAVVVPCLAIDSAGHRLGSGMGLYDRALYGLGMPQVGVTFAQQLVVTVPHESHDLRVATSITEAGLTHHDCQAP